jgi:Tol biopolymer transport system component
MKKILLTSITLAAILGVSVSQSGIARQAEDPGVLLRAAIEKEEVDGDLQGAIALYKQIVAKHSAQSAVAAKAQLRIGMCYEKLGNAEAVKAYEAVLNRFPKEAEAVAEARSRLAALRKEEPTGLTMARLLPPEVYLECPRLSPDGSKVAGIVYDMPVAEGQNVAVYDLATGKMELITKYDYGKESRWAYAPIWSPDGRKVAFLAGNNKDTTQELWIQNLPGPPRLVLKNSHGGLVPCDWLPDGSAVVALLENKNKTVGLGLVSVKDGSYREICSLLRTFDRRWGLWQASCSADASPDGQRIAFSDGPPNGSRDIYVISVDGRSKRPLIEQPADDREPRWSTDGRHIAFLNNRLGTWALWGVAVRDGQPDGPPTMILEGMENSNLASWTNKGILYSTMVYMNDIYILELNPQSYAVSTKPRVLDLAPLECQGAVRPSWSPDGRHLSFQSAAKTSNPREMLLVIMPSEGGKARKFKFFTHPVRLQGGYGGWLPDGSGHGAVFWDIEKRLYSSRLDMNTGEWKTQPIPAGEGFTGFYHTAWTSDGKAFFAIKPQTAEAGPGIVLHDMQTGDERYLYRAKPGDPPASILTASRDGKRLAMTREDGVIILVDTNTGHAERLEFGEKKQLFNPSWSPDGKHLVAIGMPEGGRDFTELFIVSIPDSKFKCLDISRHLPRNSRILNLPDWSPDGRKIAFALWAWKSETNLIQNAIPKK